MNDHEHDHDHDHDEDHDHDHDPITDGTEHPAARRARTLADLLIEKGVLRELAPYAQQTPQWVVIGLAGTVLTVVGVTWERRLRELHQAATYLERLR